MLSRQAHDDCPGEARNQFTQVRQRIPLEQLRHASRRDRWRIAADEPIVAERQKILPVAANHLEVDTDLIRSAQMNRHERRVAARGAPAASKADTGSAATLYEAGLGHLQAGRPLDAQMCCERALVLDPGHADTLQLMGLLSLQAKQYDAAIEWIGRADRADPEPDYLASLATALEQQGLHEEALKAFDKAVQNRPDDAELRTRLGDVLVRLQRPDQAIPHFDSALKLNPRYWYAAYNRALVRLQSQRFEEALADLNLCDEVEPDRAWTLHMRGATLHNLERFEEALSDATRAQALDPANADTCNNIGAALQKLRRHEEALPWFDRALALRPDFLGALKNKASTLRAVRKFDEEAAVHRLVKAIETG
jgi:tetratricopeptide (TPR) repeat protein